MELYNPEYHAALQDQIQQFEILQMQSKWDYGFD